MQAVAPALPLQQLLEKGGEIGPKLRERGRSRAPQMELLVSLIQNANY